MESMTQAPHVLPKSRSGYKFGPAGLCGGDQGEALILRVPAPAV